MALQDPIGNSQEALRHHGGNINAARRLYPHAPEPWIDLSTGINPLPYPVGAIPASAWSRLPDAGDLDALEVAARQAYGANASAGFVAAPGTQALIQWLPRLFPARRVGVLGFTYQEHARSWLAAGADVTQVAELSGLVSFDAGVVVNPNNPNGRIFAPADLAAVARHLAQRGGRLIVDEAFMDVMGRASSMVPHLPAEGVLVLRSFGKIFGLAGLRLGFAIGSVADCALMRGAMGPWAVSGPAIEIGRRALSDADWLEATVGWLRDASSRLDALLNASGFDILGGTPLFRLVQRADATAWFQHLCRAGILTRPFATRPDWLRCGLPNTPAAWQRLEAACRTPPGRSG